MRRFSLLLVVTLLLAPVGCGGDDAPAEDDGRYEVVATVGMIGDLVEAVAGERAEVTVLMGSGIDPHLYKPTRSDLQTIQSADVIFYNGLLLEGKMTDALIRAATSGKPVHAVTELLDEDVLIEPADLDGLYDPHVWMDPAAWARTVDVIEAKLAEHDPAGAEAYAANAATLKAELAELDAYAADVLARVPEGQRVLVTAHDAFNYFGDRFGYEVVGVQGLSTESEAGVRDVERIVDTLVDRDIGAVFVESTVNPKNVDALVGGARARGHDVQIGGSLFSDAMGPAGTYEGTYVGMIDHNVTTIARALGADPAPPAGGMSGKLAGAVGGAE